MVHLDHGTSTANICETLVTKYKFSQNSRKGPGGGGVVVVVVHKGNRNFKTFSTKIFTHLHGKFYKILLLEVLS
jgi:hypothetical protein